MSATREIDGELDWNRCPVEAPTAHVSSVLERGPRTDSLSLLRLVTLE